jgi:hypothetical protein
VSNWSGSTATAGVSAQSGTWSTGRGMWDPRFSIVQMRDGELFSGEEDDPVDDVPDMVASPRTMVDMSYMTDIPRWED